ncbi:MAG: Hint domain-containing protein [Paracoccaceae bacterium]
MTDQTAPGRAAPSYSAQVFPATDLEVEAGANIGDPLMPVDELCMGDVYGLLSDARTLELAIHDSAGGTGHFLRADRDGHSVAAGSEIGQRGDALALEARLTFMAPDGDKVDLLLIGHRPRGERGRVLFFLPLAPIEPKVPYTLVAADEAPAPVRLADITPVAFTRGTMITLADGRQCPIEDLAPGDKVLTRDHGAQPVRWIGQRTVRAIGAHAPVVITRGTLANESDMIVSQHQRLFIYQRGADRLTETAEVLIKARDLVDGEEVFIRRGGFVEYFHLVFDRHEIIYAECTPTESLLVNETSLGHLPEDLAQEVADRLPSLSQPPHFGSEPDKGVLARLSPAALRRTAKGG